MSFFAQPRISRIVLVLVVWGVGLCGYSCSGETSSSEPPDAGPDLYIFPDAGLILDGEPLSRDGSAHCTPAPEILDRKDNDCDTIVDEGFWAKAFVVPPATLTKLHSGCDAVQLFSESCYTASHRLCTSKPGYDGGFGPTAETPSEVKVVCLANAELRKVPVSTLVALQPSCDGGAPFSQGCVQAIHQHCGSLGYASGTGPLEPSATSIDVLCTDHATIYQVGFSGLGALEVGCSEQASFSPACRSAIDRYCTVNGHVAGFGPVELSGGQAKIACLDAG